MKIAVTYENGNVFQHFGRTENFKVYTVEDGAVVSSEVITSDGQGHGALAGLLAGQSIDLVICGGMGAGAQNALAEAGIEVITGVEGEADAAVDAFLAGALETAGTTCDHHDEDHHCAEGGCGHCGGGCHKPPFDGPNVGHVVKAHYRGTFENGTQFDSSYDRGEPLEFVCGGGMMILGFDKAVATMNVGESVDVVLAPEEAYGLADPNLIFPCPIAEMPGTEDLVVGQKVYLSDQFGRQFPCTVVAKDDTTITFDANHEMAGKTLCFHIELVEVQ